MRIPSEDLRAQGTHFLQLTRQHSRAKNDTKGKKTFFLSRVPFANRIPEGLSHPTNGRTERREID